MSRGVRAILERLEQLELDARHELGDFRPTGSLPRAPGADLDDFECLVSLSTPSDHATTQPTGPANPNEFYGSPSPAAMLLEHARPRKAGDRSSERELYSVRADVLELMAEEVESHPVNALASFRKWEGGHAFLDGMAKGTRWVIDREQHEWEKAQAAEMAALEARLRRTRRRPFRAWTAEDDRTVRARYVSDGAASLSTALGRSVASVRERATKLGVRSRRGVCRPWEQHEDKLLRKSWEYMALAKLARELNRKVSAVRWRAHELGLAYGCPRGFVYLSKAAPDAGYDVRTLRGILAWSDVRIHKSHAAARRHQGEHYVDPADVRKAAVAWLEAEDLGAAARARGLAIHTLRRWLLQAQASGVVMPRKPARGGRWRIPTKVIDLVVSDRQRWQRWQPPRAFESIPAASRRVGVEVQALTKALRAAGVPFTRARESAPHLKNWRIVLVENSDVDRVVADIKRHGGRKGYCRRNTLFTIDGVTHPLSWWAERHGLRDRTVARRLRDGWDIRTALTTEITIREPSKVRELRTLPRERAAEVILNVLRNARGLRDPAAAELGTTRTTLRSLIDRLRIRQEVDALTASFRPSSDDEEERG